MIVPNKCDLLTKRTFTKSSKRISNLEINPTALTTSDIVS